MLNLEKEFRFFQAGEGQQKKEFNGGGIFSFALARYQLFWREAHERCRAEVIAMCIDDSDGGADWLI
jgi:hypothetical protein